MKLPQFGVKYPVTTTMFFLAMIILGIVSFPRLGLDLMPEIEIPVISVFTTYEGAGPEEVESKITRVLEDRLATVKDLDSIESSSEEGMSIISLKFDWGTNLDEAANDVRDVVGLSEQFLPDEVERPTIFKFDLSSMPILILSVTAKESYPILYDLIDDRICDPLKTVPGVAAATIRGGLERQILVELDRSRLEAYHLSANHVIDALRKENLDVPGGHIRTGLKDYLIRTPEEVEVEEIGKIVLAAAEDGAAVYLKDVARVRDAFKEKVQEVEVNKRPGLIIMVQKQSGTNTVDVTDRTLKKLEELKKNLPADVNVVVARDFSDFIKGAIGNLRNALYFGGILVILIILFFLRNLRAGLIVACSIPTSLIIAFLPLYIFGYTLNIISVSSLAIAMGMVVDAAIVVLDNVHRHRERGERAQEASIFGASEVGKAIVASTLTTIAIFVPVVFIGDITGIMFTQMALVICLTLLASLFTALTLIPMLCAKFLRLKKGAAEGGSSALLQGGEGKGEAGFSQNAEGLSRRFAHSLSDVSRAEGESEGAKFYQRSERWFRRLDTAYRNLLEWSLLHCKKVIFFSALIFVITVGPITIQFLSERFDFPFPTILGTRFMPEVDSNLFRGMVELPVGTRFEETGKVMRSLEDVIAKEVPERTVMYARWGSAEGGRGRAWHGGGGTNIGMVGVRLVPKEKRQRLVKKIVDELRLLTAKYPGAKVRYSTEDPLAGLLFPEGKPFVIEIYGHDLDTGMTLAEEVKNELEKIKGVVDVEISRKMGRPQLQVKVDRDRASHLGLNVSDIGNTIQVFFSGKEATKYREKGKEYDIFVRLQEKDRQDIADLENSFISSPTGRQIRLMNVAQVVERAGPVKIERKDQQRVIRVTANLSGRDLGSAVREAGQAFSEVEIPKDFFVDFGGERQEQQKAFGSLTIALLLGMILVYMVMASQFESFRDPFIILFSVPFGMVGAVWVHLIFRQTFNLDSFIGLIMIVGIVVNNAIVLISYINILRARGLAVKDAVAEGGRARLRPILMTTFTTVFGLLPLTFSRGQGSEEWVTLGLTVIGGLLVSTLITLILVPTLYSIFEESHFRCGFGSRSK